ncbi:MAG: hypothetical protein OXG52_00550 [bacterium]|nr:hypothetical protein [bacterium]
MAIQVKQEFPHCQRCGIMIHERRRRIEAPSGGRGPLVYCSEICRDEYVEMHGLEDRGRWVTGEAAGIGRRR